MIGTTHSSGDQVNSDLQARSHMGPGFFAPMPSAVHIWLAAWLPSPTTLQAE